MDIIYKNDERCDVGAYLKRIGYCGAVKPSAENLFALQSAHVRAVPYENIDILYRRPFTLDIPDIYRKIVGCGRGGYCFELNGLFGWLLRKLGYSVTDHFARFLRDETEIPKRRHRVLRVSIGDDVYVCDVGVGSHSPEFPIKLVGGAEQIQGRYRYRIRFDSFYGTVIQEMRDDAWIDYYGFTDETQVEVDFHAIDYFCQHSPSSIFRDSAMVSLRTPYGKNTVNGSIFKITDENGFRSFEITDRNEFEDALMKYFNIKI